MPAPKITLRGLQALIAVHEEQSFSRAAQRENATQSGMSTQVKNLETALGLTLVERQRGKADLTPAGQIVYDDGRQILRALFELEQKVEDLTSALSGSIRLGIIPGLTRSVLPRALMRFREAHRNVEVSVLEEYSFSLMRRVVVGELDCAIVPAGEVLSGLTAGYLATDREVLVGGLGLLPGHPHLGPVGPRALSGAKLIMPSPRNVRRRWLDTYFDAHNVEIADVLEMDAMLATLQSVVGTDWCAVLPSVLCHADLAGTERKLHPLEGPGISTDYIVVQKADKALTRAADLLVTDLRDEIARVLEDWAEAAR